MMRYKEVITLSLATNLHSYINGFHSFYAKIGFLVSFQCQDLNFCTFFHFPAFCIQEKEAKKEAFRKYLESSGVLDALTKGFFFLLHFFLPQFLTFTVNFLIYSRFFFLCVCVVLVALYEQNDKPSSALE